MVVDGGTSDTLARRAPWRWLHRRGGQPSPHTPTQPMTVVGRQCESGDEIAVTCRTLRSSCRRPARGRHAAVPITTAWRQRTTWVRRTAGRGEGRAHPPLRPPETIADLLSSDRVYKDGRRCGAGASRAAVTRSWTVSDLRSLLVATFGGTWCCPRDIDTRRDAVDDQRVGGDHLSISPFNGGQIAINPLVGQRTVEVEAGGSFC